jgi:nucleoside-diphosphate-sugar epimerase
MTKLLIGHGYLGRRVAALWREQGHLVRATTRRACKGEELRQLGIQPVICDVLDRESLAALPVADTVVHAVALDRSAGRSMRDVYVAGLANVLSCLPPARRFIYVSSSSVYGQTHGEEVDETSPTVPQDESGRVVLEAEQLLRKRVPGAIILRFAGIYGPGRLFRSQALQSGEPIVGNPEKWLNLIHVTDGAAAVLAAEEKGQPGQTYNVCDNCSVRRCDFYRDMARYLGVAEPEFLRPASPSSVRHELANRRLSNRRLRDELCISLQYPSYREGFQNAIVRAPTIDV